MTDKTETFIKMCDCPEIQHIYQGDSNACWLTIRGKPDVFEVDYYYGCIYKPIKHADIRGTWLPTFTQSMAMVAEDRDDDHTIDIQLDALVHAAYSITATDNGELLIEEWRSKFKGASTWDRLGVAYMMYELHDKIWTGSEWVKQPQ